MTTRKPISKKMRFEVFKRDSFTCQYCGKSAPEAILHIDHITPVAKGGKTVMMNLVTSCQDCNLGKGAISLSDDTAVLKAKAQADAIAEKRAQMQMLAKWYKSLDEAELEQVNILADKFLSVSGRSLNSNGKRKIQLLLKKYTLKEILDAVDSSQRYLNYGDDEYCTRESASEALKRLPGICRNKREEQIIPELPQLFYIAGILSNRFGVEKWKIIPILKDLDEAGYDVAEMRECAVNCRSLNHFKAYFSEEA